MSVEENRECHIRKRMQEKLLWLQLSEHPELRAGDFRIGCVYGRPSADAGWL